MKSTSDQTILETAATTAASVGHELSATMHGAAELAEAACRLADKRARENPWTLALLAGALGAIVGACWARGR